MQRSRANKISIVACQLEVRNPKRRLALAPSEGCAGCGLEIGPLRSAFETTSGEPLQRCESLGSSGRCSMATRPTPMGATPGVAQRHALEHVCVCVCRDRMLWIRRRPPRAAHF